MSDKMNGCINMDGEKLNDIHITIGQNVAKRRKEFRMSQFDLNIRMGYKSASIVAKSELGIEGKHFNIYQLCKIANILDKPIEYFFTNTVK